ncbi:MAG: autotransporter subunit beta, partial [Schwartzia sp. (in: firmicutes)]
GNTLNVKTNVKAENIENFEKINFYKNGSVNAATALLKLTGGVGTTIDSLKNIKAEGFVGKYTLIENGAGITINQGGDTHSYTGEKTEHHINKDSGGKKILYEGYQFKDADVTEATGLKDGNDLYAGRSEMGNSTVHNKITINSGTFDQVFGGRTEGYTTTATDKKDSRENTVTLNGGRVNSNLYGGYTMGGKATGNIVNLNGGKVDSSLYGGEAFKDANGNTVNITGGEVLSCIYGGSANLRADGNTVNITGGKVTAGEVYGGRGGDGASGNTVNVRGGSVNALFGGDAPMYGDASDNIVDIGSVTVTGDVFGGRGGAAGRTDRNIVHLRGANVTGTVTGGNKANGVGNTLVVHSRIGGSAIGGIAGFQNVHFYIENDAVGPVNPMLKINNAADLTGKGIGVKVSGGAKVMKVGEAVRLLQTTGALTADAAIENQLKGSHGSSMKYEFEIKKAADDDKALIATVTKAGMDEETTKSFPETRAALADFVNHAGDVVAGESLSSAKKAAAAASANAEMDRYQVWAGMGANAMRAESGSYVDTKGWSFGLGWARQDGGAAKKTLFSPFVEYGRGDYDSYLDNGTHGSGSMSYFGLGVLARVESEQGLWYEGSLRGGRSTSDYRSTIGADDVSYDGSNTYYAAHLGLGKDIHVKDDTVTPYLRYFYAHQNGMTATLSSGEVYDFGSVNSHRIRLGFQYTHKVSESNEFYTGLAYEYEFNGKATATFQGYSTPSPSLKGSSGMLELGYRFTPKGQPLTYDFHFTGWQGIRRGFSGGAQVNWAF